MSQKDIDVAKEVKTIIAEQLMVDVQELKDKSNFGDDLGADSLDRLELIMALEDKFGIEIADEEAEKITTVGEAITAIQSLIQGKQKV